MDPGRRFLRGVSLAAVAFLGGYAAHLMLDSPTAHAQQAAAAQPVRASAFVLVDEEGRERAVLSMLPDGVGLALKDPKGIERLTVGRVVMPHVPQEEAWGLMVRDAAGMDRCTVGMAGDGPGLAIWDEKGIMRIGVGAGGPDQGVGMTLRDAAGTERIGIGIGPGVGGGNFGVKDQFGNEIWRALGEVGPPAPP